MLAKNGGKEKSGKKVKKFYFEKRRTFVNSPKQNDFNTFYFRNSQLARITVDESYPLQGFYIHGSRLFQDLIGKNYWKNFLSFSCKFTPKQSFYLT